MDRGDVKLFTILAETKSFRGNEEGSRIWLLKARGSAMNLMQHPSIEPLSD